MSQWRPLQAERAQRFKGYAISKPVTLGCAQSVGL